MEIPSNCDNCGLCCIGITCPPFTREETASLAVTHPELSDEIKQFKLTPRARRSVPCLWFDLLTGRCRHYEERPAACRNAKIGDPFCIAASRGVPELTPMVKRVST